MHTFAFGVDKQWDPAVWHRELYPVDCDAKLMWGKKNMYVWLGHFDVQQKLTECCKSNIMEKIKIKS